MNLETARLCNGKITCVKQGQYPNGKTSLTIDGYLSFSLVECIDSSLNGNLTKQSLFWKLKVVFNRDHAQVSANVVEDFSCIDGA